MLATKRVGNIIDLLTLETYLYVQRGLFERHKLIFAFMLTTRILIAAGKVGSTAPHSQHMAVAYQQALVFCLTRVSFASKVKQSDLDNFLRGGGALDIATVRKKPKAREPYPPAKLICCLCLF